MKKAASDKKGKFNGEELTKVVQEKIDEAKKAAEGKVDEVTDGKGGEAWKGVQSYLEGAIPGAKDVSFRFPFISGHQLRVVGSYGKLTMVMFVDPGLISPHSSC